MNANFIFAAIAVLFCCSAFAEEDIVYQNDWRAGETGYVTNAPVRHNTSVYGWSVPTIGYHTGQMYNRDDVTFPGRGFQENRDDTAFPGRGFQENRDDKTFPARDFMENRDDTTFPGRGFQENRDDHW